MSIAFTNRHSTFMAGPIASLAGIVKYHVLPFILINISLNWLIENWRCGFRNWYKHGFVTNVFIVSIFLIFLIIYQQKFGFWIAPEKYRNLHGNISLNASLNNFFSYGYFLSECSL